MCKVNKKRCYLGQRRAVFCCATERKACVTVCDALMLDFVEDCLTLWLNRQKDRRQMDNKELVDKVAKGLGRNKADVNKLLDGLATVIKDKCGEMDAVAIPGFGNFEAKKKAERVVQNPSNGKRMLVPPKIVLNFRVSNVLKSKLK